MEPSAPCHSLLHGLWPLQRQQQRQTSSGSTFRSRCARSSRFMGHVSSNCGIEMGSRRLLGMMVARVSMGMRGPDNAGETLCDPFVFNVVAGHMARWRGKCFHASVLCICFYTTLCWLMLTFSCLDDSAAAQLGTTRHRPGHPSSTRAQGRDHRAGQSSGVVHETLG